MDHTSSGEPVPSRRRPADTIVISRGAPSFARIAPSTTTFAREDGMLQTTKILIAAGSFFALTASQAAAAPQLSSPGMSCASLKEAVSHAGAVIVSYRSDRVAGLRLYDRLVRDGQF